MYQEFPFSVPDIRPVALLTVAGIAVWAIALGVNISQGVASRRLFVAMAASIVPVVCLVIGYVGVDSARHSLTVQTWPDGAPYIAPAEGWPLFSFGALIVALILSGIVRRAMARQGRRLSWYSWLFVTTTLVILGVDMAWYHSFFPLWALIELAAWLFMLLVVVLALGSWLLARWRAARASTP